VNVYKYIGLPRAVLCLIPSSCWLGALEPDVLRPYRHVLQRGGSRAPTPFPHHAVDSGSHSITSIACNLRKISIAQPTSEDLASMVRVFQAVLVKIVTEMLFGNVPHFGGP